MAEYLSGQISFTGLGSGTDFQTMIEQLTEIEATYKNRLELWKQEWEVKSEALELLNTGMVELQSTLGTMDSMSEFMVKESSSTDTSVLSAVATSSADVGTHSVEVNQLALNSIWISDSGVSSGDAAVYPSLVGTTTFDYTYDPGDGTGAKNVSVDINNSTTLEMLKNAINTDPDNAGVKATIVSDGTSSYLQVRGMDMGDDADLTITSTSFGGLGDFSETQANQSAQVKVNGWPASNGWIESNSNTLSDSIEGVSLTLKDVGSVQVNTEVNTDEMKENVRTFVNKMNEVRTLAMKLTEVDTDSETVTGSVMTGNYAIQLTVSNLKQAVADKAQGFKYYDSTTEEGDMYAALAQVGILTDAEEGSETMGLLVIDEDKLEEAFDNDPEGVAELFAATDIGTQDNDTGSFNYYSHIHDLTKPGTYDVSYEIDASGNIINADIAGETVSVNNTDKTITVTTGDASGLVITVNDTVQGGPYTGDVRIKQGKLGEIEGLLGEYTNDTTGSLNIVKDNYATIIENIDSKIEYEEERLTKYAYNMRMKYARLEALLGEYDQINSSLSSGIAQLSST